MRRRIGRDPSAVAAFATLTGNRLYGDAGSPAMAAGDDPRAIRAIAVSAEDVVMALESNLRGSEEWTVLRVTPPFSGRMRARIHVVADRADPDGTLAGEESDGRAGGGPPDPVLVPPSSLVADAPPYPTPDDTEDELRSDPDAEYAPDRHRERHVAAVEEWRERIRESFVDGVEIPVDGGTHRVDVSILG